MSAGSTFVYVTLNANGNFLHISNHLTEICHLRCIHHLVIRCLYVHVKWQFWLIFPAYLCII